MIFRLSKAERIFVQNVCAKKVLREVSQQEDK